MKGKRVLRLTVPYSDEDGYLSDKLATLLREIAAYCETTKLPDPQNVEIQLPHGSFSWVRIEAEQKYEKIEGDARS